MKKHTITPTSGLYITANGGYVLATSLLLLVIMVMLGVSMYGNVTVQEKMADNMRVKSRTLVAVKSAVQSNWKYSVLVDAMMPGTSTNTIQIEDQFDSDNITLTGEVKVCYLGESICAGTAMDASPGSNAYVCKAFFAAGYVDEAASNTSTTIEQAGFLLMYHSDEPPNCNSAQQDSISVNNINGSVAVAIPSIDVQESLN